MLMLLDFFFVLGCGNCQRFYGNLSYLHKTLSANYRFKVKRNWSIVALVLVLYFYLDLVKDLSFYSNGEFRTFTKDT